MLVEFVTCWVCYGTDLDVSSNVVLCCCVLGLLLYLVVCIGLFFVFCMWFWNVVLVCAICACFSAFYLAGVFDCLLAILSLGCSLHCLGFACFEIRVWLCLGY